MHRVRRRKIAPGVRFDGGMMTLDKARYRIDREPHDSIEFRPFTRALLRRRRSFFLPYSSDSSSSSSDSSSESSSSSPL